jgi:membrane protein involved in colicin uptake
MHHLKFTATVAKTRYRQTRAGKRTFLALIAALMVLGTVGADLAFAPLPVNADSEAGSEAGSESGAYLRRRRGRWRNNQNQQQNQQSMAAKQELRREAKERNQAQLLQQRSLARGPQIKEYGHQHSGQQFRSGQSNQGQANQGQSNQGQPNQGQNNQTP